MLRGYRSAGTRLLRAVGGAVAVLACLPGFASAATINVDHNTDEFGSAMTCSLRDAVRAASNDTNAHEGDCEVGSAVELDTIQLAALTYTLTIGPDVVPDDTNGDLDLTTGTFGVTILGASPTTSIIDGNLTDRVLDIPNSGSTAPVTLNSVTIQHGKVAARGGGIFARDKLTLSDARVINNETTGGAANNGGGIDMGDDGLALLSSSVSQNKATGPGAGISLGNGSGLTTSGQSHIDGNINSVSEGGGINQNAATDDILIGPGTTVNDNAALGNGGGIHANGGGNAITINGASVSGNDVTEFTGGSNVRGGGIRLVSTDPLQVINGSVISGNTVTGDRVSGGGIEFNGTGTSVLTITGSTVSGNFATNEDNGMSDFSPGGGGVSVLGTVGPTLITDSTIAGNTLTIDDDQDVAAGGGIRVEPSMTMDSSTVSGNIIAGDPTLAAGGGFHSGSPTGPTKIINSTFALNNGSPAAIGGGISIDATNHTLTIVHTTIAANSAPASAGLNVGGAMYTLRGLLIDNGPNACSDNPLVTNGFNVDAGTSCVGLTNDSDLDNTDASIGPLASNGGPTQTIALLGPASVFDAVPTTAPNCTDLTGITPLNLDQRNELRAQGAGCEPGAWEGLPPAPTPPAPPAATPTLPAATPVPRKKCKKGRKLRRGKCVKKKRKK